MQDMTNLAPVAAGPVSPSAELLLQGSIDNSISRRLQYSDGAHDQLPQHVGQNRSCSSRAAGPVSPSTVSKELPLRRSIDNSITRRLWYRDCAQYQLPRHVQQDLAPVGQLVRVRASTTSQELLLQCSITSSIPSQYYRAYALLQVSQHAGQDPPCSSWAAGPCQSQPSTALLL